MQVFEYWEERQAAQTTAERAADEERARQRKAAADSGRFASHVRTAKCAVGIPPFLRDSQGAQGEATMRNVQPCVAVAKASTAAAGCAAGIPCASQADAGADACGADAQETGAALAEGAAQEIAVPQRADSATAAAAADDPFAGLNLPEGYKLTEVEGEWVLVPTDEAPAPIRLKIRTDHIAALVGAHSYYLYDRSLMTDVFARWAFLAAEDDPVATFAECVRQDSRVYLRPMPLESLRNVPFNMESAQIEQAFRDARAAGGYDDIKRIEASNGDVYFFSTEYLSGDLAASLAEWDAVERSMNV